MEKSALILGSSGLIGNSLMEQLLDHPGYKEVRVLVRKKLERQHPKLKQIWVNFDKLHDHSTEITADVVFCCLGSTKKKTPDQTQYKKIDYQYPLEVAAIALKNGASQYHLVSSIGANVNSGTFYRHIKGEVERDLKKIAFPTIHIYRPSLLEGKRKEKRTIEKIIVTLVSILNPLLIGSLSGYRTIRIEKVALAMIRKSMDTQKGIFIHPSSAIEKISS